MLKESVHRDKSNNMELLMDTPFKMYQNIELMNELGHLAIEIQSKQVVLFKSLDNILNTKDKISRKK